METCLWFVWGNDGHVFERFPVEVVEEGVCLDFAGSFRSESLVGVLDDELVDQVDVVVADLERDVFVAENYLRGFERFFDLGAVFAFVWPLRQAQLPFRRRTRT